MTVIESYKKYRFGSFQGLGQKRIVQLVRHLENPPDPKAGVLTGRAGTHLIELEDLDQVVIKHYLRGGLLSSVNRRTYMGIKNSRAKLEFELLSHIQDLGVNTPVPVAFVSRGKLLYQTWLVTKYIPDAKNLSEIITSEPKKAERAIINLAEQVNILISHNILHIDLHPGNVLVDPHERIYIIDFDKARTGSAKKSALGRYYLQRWKRAVYKYRLPEFVNEIMLNKLEY
ncbi:MAG: lipopolysaccharide kinase InaA family protein [Thermodesulfobacteriota bacterium]